MYIHTFTFINGLIQLFLFEELQAIFITSRQEWQPIMNKIICKYFSHIARQQQYKSTKQYCQDSELSACKFITWSAS